MQYWKVIWAGETMCTALAKLADAKLLCWALDSEYKYGIEQEHFSTAGVVRKYQLPQNCAINMSFSNFLFAVRFLAIQSKTSKEWEKNTHIVISIAPHKYVIFQQFIVFHLSFVCECFFYYSQLSLHAISVDNNNFVFSHFLAWL